MAWHTLSMSPLIWEIGGDSARQDGREKGEWDRMDAEVDEEPAHGTTAFEEPPTWEGPELGEAGEEAVVDTQHNVQGRARLGLEHRAPPKVHSRGYG